MILVTDSDEDTILRYRRLLYANGLLSTGVCYRYAIQMPDKGNLEAVLITNPYDSEKPARFCYSYHPRHPGIPVVMMRQPLRDDPPDMRDADIVINADMTVYKQINTLLLELSRYHKRDVADCMAGDARDHLLMPAPTWGGTPFYLTPAERAIYRYLICAHPRPVTAKELLRHCAKPGTSPTLCNIPSHIYRINAKTTRVLGIHVIGCPDNLGYRLLF